MYFEGMLNAYPTVHINFWIQHEKLCWVDNCRCIHGVNDFFYNFFQCLEDKEDLAQQFRFRKI